MNLRKPIDEKKSVSASSIMAKRAKEKMVGPIKNAGKSIMKGVYKYMNKKLK